MKEFQDVLTVFLNGYRKLLILVAGVGLAGIIAAGFYGGFLLQTEGAIDRFEGVNWFASDKTIVEDFGEPTSPEKNDQYKKLHKDFKGRELFYPDRRRFGETVDVGFVVHSLFGLVKGYYYVHFEEGNDCLKTSLKFYDLFKEKFDLTKISGGLRNKSRYRYCYSVHSGNATGYIQWEDPNGTLVTFYLGGRYSQGKLLIQVETPTFYDLLHNSGLGDVHYSFPIQYFLRR